MLTIYGLDFSFPANKVRFTANYLGLDYEYKRVDLGAGEGQTDAYKAIHPAGKIPAMDDGGFKLFESNAICKYLARKSKSEIYPTDLQKQALVDQWLDFGSMHVGAATGRVAWNRMLAPVMKAPVDEQSLKDGENFLKRFLPVVDAQLAKTKYLAGSEFTIADIGMLASIDPLEADVLKIDLSPYKTLLTWRNELMKKDWYTKCHKNFSELLLAFKA